MLTGRFHANSWENGFEILTHWQGKAASPLSSEGFSVFALREAPKKNLTTTNPPVLVNGTQKGVQLKGVLKRSLLAQFVLRESGLFRRSS